MKKIKKAFLLVSFIVVSSCSSSDDDAPVIITPPQSSTCTSTIPFFQTGKTMTYKMTQFGTVAGTLKLTVGTCNGDGFSIAREVFNTSGTLTSSATDLWKESDNFLLSDSNSNGDYFSKIYKKDAVLGETWQVLRPDGSTVYHEVVNTDVVVTVPAGTFHCVEYVYTTSSTVNESHIFWNHEVGQIKEDAGFVINELQSHN